MNRKRRSGPFARPVKRPRIATNIRFKAGRSRTTTNQRRRRRNELRSNNEDLQQSSRSSGRRMRFTNRFTRRFVSKSVENQLQSIRLTSPYGGVSGPLFFPNYQRNAGELKRAPCTLIDLSSTRNLASIGGVATLQTPQTTWNIQFTNETDTGIVQFEPAGSGWQLMPESTSANLSSTVDKPLRADYLKYVRADFLFYHPLTIATKINVQLVQFMDDRLVPRQTVYPATAETGDVFATAFWQSLMKAYMHNPIDPVNTASYARYLKVLSSETFVLNPKESTEATNTRYKISKMFKNLNRHQKYDWNQSDRMNMDTEEVQVNTGDFHVTTQPKARIYLMIRALAPEKTGDTYPPVAWWDEWPSCDLYLRTCHTVSN